MSDYYSGYYHNSWDSFDRESKEKKCQHKWKATVLIVSTVFDCELCGIKKEDYDKEQENKSKK